MIYYRALRLAGRTKLPFGWTVEVSALPSPTLRVVDYGGTDNVTGKPTSWRGRKWLLSEHMTDGEVVQTIFLATRVAIEHEMREQFLFMGQAIFDPHYDINKLVALRSQPDALKEREAPVDKQSLGTDRP